MLAYRQIRVIPEDNLCFKNMFIQILEQKTNPREIPSLHYYCKERLPKHALNYKPRGRRDRGRPRKQWQCVDAGTGQTT